MHELHIDALVQLTADIPELGLTRGANGIVCSTWLNPATAYEVEFDHPSTRCKVRVLLLRQQLRSFNPDVKQ